MSDLRGFVDFFDGQHLCGWALDSTDADRVVSVDIFVDDMYVASIACDQFRHDMHLVSEENPNKSFVYTFDQPLGSSPGPLILPEIPRISVRFAGTDLPLLVVKDLLGVVNAGSHKPAEVLCISSDNRFLPTPPSEMVEHVAGDGTTATAYRAVGMQLVLDLLHFGLVTDASCTIADIGCGSGRIATHLAPFLGDRGQYFGFDTWEGGIRWASETITPVYPSFRFQQLRAPDHQHGDPGYVGETAYPIPLADASCDLVLATSVLTHLTRGAASQYLKEFRRLLKDDGRAYVTFFIFDDEAERLLSGMKLRRDADGAYFDHRNFFDTYFAEDAVSGLLEESGLHPILKRYGQWRGEAYSRRMPVGYQDLFILRPARD